MFVTVHLVIIRFLYETISIEIHESSYCEIEMIDRIYLYLAIKSEIMIIIFDEKLFYKQRIPRRIKIPHFLYVH